MCVCVRAYNARAIIYGGGSALKELPRARGEWWAAREYIVWQPHNGYLLLQRFPRERAANKTHVGEKNKNRSVEKKGGGTRARLIHRVRCDTHAAAARIIYYFIMYVRKARARAVEEKSADVYICIYVYIIIYVYMIL
jgi:hypothetical protein